MWLDRIPTKTRRILIVWYDIASICLALFLAFLLRFEGNIPAAELRLLAKLFLFVLPVRMFFFVHYGLYRGVWRYASIEDLMAIFKAVSLSSMLVVVLGWFLFGFAGFPRSVFVIDWTLVVMLVGGSRFSVRAVRYQSRRFVDGRRTLIVGADDAGESLLRSLLYKTEELQVVGLLSDSTNKLNKRIHGVPVLGTLNDLAELIANERIKEVLIALPSASAAVLREIVTQCQSANVRIRRVPPIKDLLNGQISLGHLREVQLEDLLGREPVNLDNDNVRRYLRNKTVMVTGAGGSIGSEICRQIARCHPQLLVALDQAENGLFHLDVNLAQHYPEVPRHLVVANITDQARLNQAFVRFRPQVIFHAAAHKHVPLMEHNKLEAVKNNVIGTMTLAKAAKRFGVDKMVMISTDKAVNPTSIMGASKRLAEMILQRMARNSKTAFITVRFGNVLGSDGSVVPLFKEQILSGGPVTVTDPNIKRFFMTIPEAVQLVLQAGEMGEGGEIYVLDMGQPIKILDLAKNLITLSGYKPDEIGIRFVGLRPGEKLYEELWLNDEHVQPTSHSKILVAASSTPLHELNGELHDLLECLSSGSEKKLLRLLSQLVPTYRPASNGRISCDETNAPQTTLEGL